MGQLLKGYKLYELFDKALHTLLSLISCGEGSVQSNQTELTSKTSTHLSFSALKWFEKVRGGSRGLNHSETVYRYPTHLVTTVKMRFEKVRYSRTTPNSRHFYTPCFLCTEVVREGSRRFEGVEPL